MQNTIYGFLFKATLQSFRQPNVYVNIAKALPQSVVLLLVGNKWVSDVNEMKKKAGRRDINIPPGWELKARERYPGLHKNTSHAYSQDVLSFMLGRQGKDVHTGNKKRNKTT